jgi:hypothetical protein
VAAALDLARRGSASSSVVRKRPTRHADYQPLMQWAANIVALALEHIMQVEALERLRHEVADERDRAHSAMYDLGERVKELTALHHTARLLEDEQIGVADLLQKIADLLPPAFQFPDVTEARVSYGDVVVGTPGFAETAWRLAQEFVTGDGTKGGLEVVYLQDRPPSVEGPFLREERHLIDSLADMVTAALDKRRADTALRESETQLRNARDRARLLLEINNSVVSELDLRRLLDVISKLLGEKIPHHFASIGLWEEDEQRLRRHALVFASDNEHLVEEGRLVAIGSPGDVAFRRGETTLFNWDDILELGEPTVSVMAVEGLRSVCCVPMKTARGGYGVLNVGKPRTTPSRPTRWRCSRRWRGSSPSRSRTPSASGAPSGTARTRWNSATVSSCCSTSTTSCWRSPSRMPSGCRCSPWRRCSSITTTPRS